MNQNNSSLPDHQGLRKCISPGCNYFITRKDTLAQSSRDLLCEVCQAEMSKKTPLKQKGIWAKFKEAVGSCFGQLFDPEGCRICNFFNQTNPDECQRMYCPECKLVYCGMDLWKVIMIGYKKIIEQKIFAFCYFSLNFYF